MWTYVFIGILGLTGGVILLSVVKTCIETIVFRRAAAKTEGRVIRLATTHDSDGQTMYLPVFEYRANDGTRYEHTSTVASSPPAYKVGDTRAVLYLRKNPQNAKIDSFIELWLVKIIFTIIGFACLGAAFLIYRNK